MSIVTMKELLEAGVHFGHQTRRWDPRMKPYIFTERNGIHIIDLQRTITLLKSAYNAVKELAKSNGTILFVGTKRQAQSAIVEEANRCGMPYVSNRWLGGMLTNFSTIQKSIQRLKKLERMEVDGSFEFMTKKEVIRLTREKEKLLKNIGGIKDLESLPDMIFVIDPKKEAIAVAEAMRLKVPIVAIIDTNCNPDGINHPIPGNDDAIRAINLFSAIVSSAVVEGQNEASKIEVAEDSQIVSLEDEEKARAEKEKAEEVQDYLSDEELEETGEKVVLQEDNAPPAESGVADSISITDEASEVSAASALENKDDTVQQEPSVTPEVNVVQVETDEEKEAEDSPETTSAPESSEELQSPKDDKVDESDEADKADESDKVGVAGEADTDLADNDVQASEPADEEVKQDAQEDEEKKDSKIS